MSALIIQSRNCPICNSKARREIDIAISARCGDSMFEPDPKDMVVLLEDIDSIVKNMALDDKIGLSELVIHITQHQVASNIEQFTVRSEGSLLFAGEKVFQKINPVDFLDYSLAVAAEKIATGELKLTPSFVINAIITRWRMTGTAGQDSLLEGLHDKLRNQQINPESPLGMARVQRDTALSGDSVPEEREE